MGMVKEFKEFALKGNVVDLAVGLIMGAAFGEIVKSLVNDVLMPPLGYVMDKGKSFADMALVMTTPDGKEINIAYGKCISALISFLAVAFCVFLMVKAINRLKRQQAAAPAAPPAQEVLLTEIRDLLKARNA